MSLRSWLVGLLEGDPSITDLVGDRIYQASALRTAQMVKPYIVYHLGNDTSEGLSELHLAHRQFLQIWVHDEPGDYDLIDEVGDELKELFTGAGSKVDHVITTRFLERSADFNDQVLGTIFRYLRFQIILGG